MWRRRPDTRLLRTFMEKTLANAGSSSDEPPSKKAKLCDGGDDAASNEGTRARESVEASGVSQHATVLNAIRDIIFCTITQRPMRNPVLAEDGRVYEEDAIQEWFRVCKAQRKPITAPLPTSAQRGVAMGETLVPFPLANSLVESAIQNNWLPQEDVATYRKECSLDFVRRVTALAGQHEKHAVAAKVYLACALLDGNGIVYYMSCNRRGVELPIEGGRDIPRARKLCHEALAFAHDDNSKSSNCKPSFPFPGSGLTQVPEHSYETFYESVYANANICLLRAHLLEKGVTNEEFCRGHVSANVRDVAFKILTDAYYFNSFAATVTLWRSAHQNEGDQISKLNAVRKWIYALLEQEKHPHLPAEFYLISTDNGFLHSVSCTAYCNTARAMLKKMPTAKAYLQRSSQNKGS